jgi:putative FmdB family regulatory protein
MPIYQYQCTDCGHGLEALQKMSDPKLVDCPECNNPTLKKQLTAAAFKLKGTGWYETDSKNIGKKPAEQKPAEKKAATKTESKPSASVE